MFTVGVNNTQTPNCAYLTLECTKCSKFCGKRLTLPQQPVVLTYLHKIPPPSIVTCIVTPKDPDPRRNNMDFVTSRVIPPLRRAQSNSSLPCDPSNYYKRGAHPFPDALSDVTALLSVRDRVIEIKVLSFALRWMLLLLLMTR